MSVKERHQRCLRQYYKHNIIPAGRKGRVFCRVSVRSLLL